MPTFDRIEMLSRLRSCQEILAAWGRRMLFLLG
jgi:hypothetical protein